MAAPGSIDRSAPDISRPVVADLAVAKRQCASLGVLFGRCGSVSNRQTDGEQVDGSGKFVGEAWPTALTR